MRHTFLVCITLAALAALAHGCEAPHYPDYDRGLLLRETADVAIVPAYDRAALDGVALHAATTALCAAPSMATLTAARDAWRAAVVSWRTTTAFQIGPVVDMNLPAEVATWPADPAGIEAIVTSADPLTPTVDARGARSKGFFALEYLLFAYPGYTAADDAMTLAALGDVHRCQYADAVGAHIQSITTRASMIWSPSGQDFATTFATAGAPGNTTYRYQQAAIDALVSGLSDTIEGTRDRRIGKPLGLLMPVAPVESPYAHVSVALMSAALEGVERGWTASTHNFDAFLRTRNVAFADRFLQELSAARDATDALASPPAGTPFETYVTGTDHAAGQTAFDALAAAQLTLRADVATTLGLSIPIHIDGD